MRISRFYNTTTTTTTTTTNSNITTTTTTTTPPQQHTYSNDKRDEAEHPGEHVLAGDVCVQRVKHVACGVQVILASPDQRGDPAHLERQLQGEIHAHVPPVTDHFLQEQIQLLCEQFHLTIKIEFK